MNMLLRLGLGLSHRIGSGGSANAAPTDIALSASTVAEDAELGEVVGVLSATDPEDDAVTFTLVDDAGGLFDIDGTDLIVAGVLDYETATSHNVTVRATDSEGNTRDEVFAITVTDVSEAVPWTPAELGADVVMWFESDPNDATNYTLSSGTIVDRWKDLSGSDDHMDATLTTRPSIETVADWGGKYGVKFDGSNDGLAQVTSPVVAQPLTLCMLYRTPATIDDLDACVELVVAAISMKWSGVSDKPHAFCGSAVARSNTVLNVSTSYIDITHLDGASSYCRLNGNAADPTTFNPGTSGWSGNGGLFARGGFSAFAGHWRYLIVVDRALTSDEYQKMEGWMAHNSDRLASLPGGHPYKTNPPTV
jgi:hypothetical protein